MHVALCDNVDTKTAMEAVRELIAAANAYVRQYEVDKRVPNCFLLKQVALWITNLFKIFGLVGEPNADAIGFGETASSGEGVSAQSREEELMPYLNALAQFRWVGGLWIE